MVEQVGYVRLPIKHLNKRNACLALKSTPKLKPFYPLVTLFLLEGPLLALMFFAKIASRTLNKLLNSQTPGNKLFISQNPVVDQYAVIMGTLHVP